MLNKIQNKMSRIASAQGFLKDVKSGSIFPVFEKETMRNIEIDNQSSIKKKLDHQIQFVVVSENEYNEYKYGKIEKVEYGSIKTIKEVGEKKPIKRKPGHKPVKK